MIKIAIIDDDELFVSALIQLLAKSSKFSCEVKAFSLGDFFEQISVGIQLDIILLNIALGEVNSLSHLGKLKKLLPNTKIIIMAGIQDQTFVIQALQQGADSYCLKESITYQLIDVIQGTYDGGAYITPKAAAGIVELLRQKKQTEELASLTFKSDRVKEYWGLTRREVQIAEGLFQEKTYKEIAATYNIALDTVRHYLKSLYKKLEVNNRTKLINKIKHLISD